MFRKKCIVCDRVGWFWEPGWRDESKSEVAQRAKRFMFEFYLHPGLVELASRYRASEATQVRKKPQQETEPPVQKYCPDCAKKNRVDTPAAPQAAPTAPHVEDFMEKIRLLPNRALVALAFRCASRVYIHLPLLTQWFPKDKQQVVHLTMSTAETYAKGQPISVEVAHKSTLVIQTWATDYTDWPSVGPALGVFGLAAKVLAFADAADRKIGANSSIGADATFMAMYALTGKAFLDAADVATDIDDATMYKQLVFTATTAISDDLD